MRVDAHMRAPRPRSNQAVYVVTRTYLDSNGVRKFDTDVWRIFSEVKGDTLFHNTALSLIVEYYKARFPLRQVHVFTDGCRPIQRQAKFLSHCLLPIRAPSGDQRVG